MSFEVDRINLEAKEYQLNSPFLGKPFFLFVEPKKPVCGTHNCTQCPQKYINCAHEQGANAQCSYLGIDYSNNPLDDKSSNASAGVNSSRMWINYYPFQSLEYMASKKVTSFTLTWSTQPSITGQLTEVMPLPGS